MQHDEREELRAVIRDAIDAFEVQLRAQRTIWVARGDRGCLAAFEKVLDHREAACQDLEVALDRARHDITALACALEAAAVEHGKPRSRADSLARRAVLDLLTAITDLEDEIFEAREAADADAGRSATGA